MLNNLLILLLSLTILVACDGGNNINTPTPPTNNSIPTESQPKPSGNESQPDNPPTPTVTLESVIITTNKNDIYIGESAQLHVMAYYSNNTTKNITNEIKWHSNESNYTYSTTTKGLLYGIHAGTKSIQFSYNNMLSNSIQLTVKPTLFYSVNNSVYSSYGLISDKAYYVGRPGTSVIVINSKLYLSQFSSNKQMLYITYLDLASESKAWHSLKELQFHLGTLPTIYDSAQLANIAGSLLVRGSDDDDSAYWWDASSANWVKPYIPEPFVAHLNKLYTVGGMGSYYSNIYYSDINKQLPLTSQSWHTLTTTTTKDIDSPSKLYILNHRLYNIPEYDGIYDDDESFVISSIDISKSNAAWVQHFTPKLSKYTKQSSVSDSTMIESTLYISFADNSHNAKIFSIKNLQESIPTVTTIVSPPIPHIDISNKIILTHLGTTLYAINDMVFSDICSLDTSNPNAKWQLVQSYNSLPETGHGIQAVYAAY